MLHINAYMLSGIVLGALDNWTGLCAITFFIGFGLGGNIPIDATIVLEFLPNVSTPVIYATELVVDGATAGSAIPTRCLERLPACW